MIVVVVAIGTIGLHYIEGYSYLDAFYYTSMVATGQGPTSTPVTAAGKVFVSILAFVSVGTVVTSLVFVFGPVALALARTGAEKAEDDFGKLEKDAERELKKED